MVTKKSASQGKATKRPEKKTAANPSAAKSTVSAARKGPRSAADPAARKMDGTQKLAARLARHRNWDRATDPPLL